MWLGVSDQFSGLDERVSIVMPLETLCRLYREPRRQRDILLLPLLVKMKIIVNQQLGSTGLCVAPAPSSQPVEHAGGRLSPRLLHGPRCSPGVLQHLSPHSTLSSSSILSVDLSIMFLIECRM